MIYLDYAAATPVESDVLNRFNEINNKCFANPNSNHSLGKKSKRIIDESIKNIANILNCSSDEIIFTSGASETNNLVIKGIAQRYKNKGKHILLGSFEHNSIISASLSDSLGLEIELVNVLKNGLIDLDDLKNKIRKDTILVSISAVDSELGIRQPIEEIADIVKEHDVYFHTDATHAIGKINIDYSNCDLITVSPHKFYGLSGISILVKRNNVMLKPQIEGGKSTTVFRSGTPETALIASSALALKLAIDNQEKRYNYVSNLNKILVNMLKEYKNIIFNSNEYSIPHIINISILNTKSQKMVDLLDQRNIYVSAKTSCCPIETPSKMVYALTKDKQIASSSIRISLSHLTTNEEIDEFIKVFDEILRSI